MLNTLWSDCHFGFTSRLRRLRTAIMLNWPLVQRALFCQVAQILEMQELFRAARCFPALKLLKGLRGA